MRVFSDHTWGISSAQDRVLALVSGFGPDKARNRKFMVLQAFIDDSREGDGGDVFVLAGHIASAETWLKFSADWDEVLPYGIKHKNGYYFFKMSQMAMTDERMARVPCFYRIMEKHVLVSLSCVLNLSDLRKAKVRAAKIWKDKTCNEIDWGFLEYPYLFAFRVLMDMFHANRRQLEKILPPTEKIDFIFDKQSEEKFIKQAWDEYMEKRPEEIRELYGHAPHFEDDNEYLPLQAADLWAWWVRKWNIEGIPEEQGEFPGWKPNRVYPKIAISFDEDAIVKAILSNLEDGSGLSGKSSLGGNNSL